MTTKTKSLIGLIFISVVDAVVPLPIIGAVLIYVVLQRPPWFIDVVQEIYLERDTRL